MGDPAVRGPGLLELLDDRPADEAPAVENAADRAIELRPKRLRLAPQVEEGDAHQYDPACSR